MRAFTRYTFLCENDSLLDLRKELQIDPCEAYESQDDGRMDSRTCRTGGILRRARETDASI